jgi:hypothetical protein
MLFAIFFALFASIADLWQVILLGITLILFNFMLAINFYCHFIFFLLIMPAYIKE